jgi:salicylate hydroxylase
VVEQAPALGEIGAGIQLSANGVEVLRQLGLREALAETAVYPETWQNLDLATGKVLLESPLGERAESLYGSPFYHMHRADLLGVLASAVPADMLRLGSRCVHLEQDENGASVTLESGQTLRADAVVGADGIRSFIREQLHGAGNPTFAGFHGWRALVPVDRLKGVDLEHRTYIWTGLGKCIVGYWVRGGQFFNLLAIVPGADERRESWINMSTVENLLQAVQGSEERIMRVAEAVEEPFITGLFYRDPLLSWSKDRVGLLGDAAHPMVPHLAQGACQSIEDAWIMATCLARHGAAGVAEAFEEYEQRRRPRTTKVQANARDAARLYHTEDEAELTERNARWEGISQIDADRTSIWSWLYDYSAVEAAQAPAGAVFGIASATVGQRMQRPIAQRAADQYRNVFGPDDIARGFDGMRDAYERFLLKSFPVSPETSVVEVTSDNVRGFWVQPQDSGSDVVLLHLHGGGLVMGSARTSLDLASRLAEAAGGRCLTLDYRLAPEHPFPAALDDAVAAYRWLLSQGIPADHILLSGESAGGGLALSAVFALAEAGDPLPAGVVAISPVTDHTVSGESITEFHGQDVFVDRDRLVHFAAAYFQAHDARDPMVSPLFGDFTNFPPLLLQAVRGEVLMSDSTRLAARAEAAGVEVTLDLYDDSVHVFPTFPFLPETSEVLERVKSFVQQHVRDDKISVAAVRS